MSEMIARANTILLHARRATVVLAGGLALAFFALVLYRLAWGSLTLPWITFLIALLGFLTWAILTRYRALDLRFREDGIERQLRRQPQFIPWAQIETISFVGALMRVRLRDGSHFQVRLELAGALKPLHELLQVKFGPAIE